MGGGGGRGGESIMTMYVIQDLCLIFIYQSHNFADDSGASYLQGKISSLAKVEGQTRQLSNLY